MATLLFPLYIYPSNQGASWAPIVSAVKTNPLAKTIMVVNPGNGPGKSVDPNYSAAIETLSSAGIPMAGYVFTKYGARPLDSVVDDLSVWSKLYPKVSAIFVDNMANKPGLENYYTRLTGSAKSLGYRMVMGNPGSPIPTSYFGTVDSAVIYENFGYPKSAQALDPEGWYSSHRGSFGMIAHGVDVLDQEFIASAARVVEFMCVTQTYHAIPPYFEQLLSTLSGL